MKDAFHLLKVSLCNYVCLVTSTVEDTLCVETDASARGVGGVLNVIHNDIVLSAGFYSRQLHGAEKRYSATELEALAVLATVKHFAHHFVV